MKFSFKPGCRISDNIRRIAAQQVLLARKYLTDSPGGDIHKGHHEARKCFKRLRGLLRMARPALGKKLYRRENICFRDAARLLSAARDAQALVETFDQLEKTYGLRVNSERMRALRIGLSDRRERMLRDRQDSLYRDALESAAALLKKRPKNFRKKIQKRLHIHST